MNTTQFECYPSSSMIMVAIQAMVALIVIWLLGDFLYARLVGWNLRRWECDVKRDPDGVREGCREFTVGRGEPALLLVHGFADSPAVFQPLAEALSGRGFTCRALRLPDSSIPRERAAGVTREDQLATIAQEMHALLQLHPRVWIVAHSLGGALSLDYVVRHPGEAEGLVLLAPLLAVSRRRSPLLPPNVWFRLLDRLLIFTRMCVSPFPLDVHRPDIREFKLHDRHIPRTIYRELFRACAAVRHRARDVTLPLLVFLSKDDRVTDWSSAVRFFESCPSSRKKVVFLPDSGHMIPLDHDLPAVITGIERFIRTH